MEKPILFNTEMVQAILECRKTVTRRVIKRNILNHCDIDTDGTILGYCDGDGDWWDIERLCRYQVGDNLYVRETWAKIPGASSKGGFAYKYKASKEGGYWNKVKGFKWRSSIHMPKEAARIFLKVTDVRVERLWDITACDCRKEGCGEGSSIDPNHYASEEWYARMGLDDDYDSASFAGLWNSTIPKEDLEQYGWNANPWVFVIEFERIDETRVKPA